MLLTKEDREFYASLKLGQIIHYDSNFHRFIRCEVVHQNGENRLKPIALVGDWPKEKLPHYTPEGELTMGDADMLANEQTITPHIIFLYEYPGYGYRDKDLPEPQTLQPIEIVIPKMTERQTKDAVFYRAVRDVREILGTKDAAPRALLVKAKKAIEEVLVQKSSRKNNS